MKGYTTFLNSKTGASTSDAVQSHTQDTKLFQVLLSNTNSSSQHYSFVCTQLNGFKYSKWLNSSIWCIDGTQTGTTTLGQSGPESNHSEGVLHILKGSRTGALPSDAV